jgi:uncharacterized membrane protein
MAAALALPIVNFGRALPSDRNARWNKTQSSHSASFVDIAAKALSPAINDPTTAVLAVDQLHHLLHSVATRQLDTGRIHDEEGKLRLAYRTPDWDNFVGLANIEVRQYGKDGIQIARRMRAMLEKLIEVVPPQRAAPLRRELELLSRGVERSFQDPEDRLRAASADSLGVGGASRAQGCD